MADQSTLPVVVLATFDQPLRTCVAVGATKEGELFVVKFKHSTREGMTGYSYRRRQGHLSL